MADEPFASPASNKQQPPPHSQHHSHRQNHHHHIQQQQQQQQHQHYIQVPPLSQVGQAQQQQQQIHHNSSPALAGDQFPGSGAATRSLLPLHHHAGALQLPHNSPLNQLTPDSAPRAGAGKPRSDVSATGGHGRDDAWTEVATLALIDAWGERYLHLNRGNLKQKHWREVADEVNRRSALDETSSAKASKSDVQCKNRLDTLKKKYKVEKSRLLAAASDGNGSPSKWPFFVKLDELVGPSKKGKKQQRVTTTTTANHAANPANNNGNLRLREEQIHQLNHPGKFHLQQQQQQQQSQRQQQQATSNSSSSREYSAGTTDSCEENGVAGAEAGKSSASNKKRRLDGGPFRDLARAIVKFGEIYERIESAKQQQMMDLERQRMEFTKDMELQRMQLFMQMQLELAKLKHGGKHGSASAAWQQQQQQL